MTKLTNALKQMLNALANQHASENLSLREKTKYLGFGSGLPESAVAEVAAEAIPTGSSRRRVALYLGSELPKEVMTYVIETCESLQHDLTILSFESERISNDLLEPYMEPLNKAGIDMNLTLLSGNPITGLARFLKGRSEIAFLACKENGYLGRSYITGTIDKNLMPIPVVVVATEKSASMDKIQTTEQEKADSARIA